REQEGIGKMKMPQARLQSEGRTRSEAVQTLPLKCSHNNSANVRPYLSAAQVARVARTHLPPSSRVLCSARPRLARETTTSSCVGLLSHTATLALAPARPVPAREHSNLDDCPRRLSAPPGHPARRCSVRLYAGKLLCARHRVFL
ncbi:hypothetical protein JI435_415540, partial [Parastagonospora nodorum SN15]